LNPEFLAKKNEQLTDAAAVWIGFGCVLADAYKNVGERYAEHARSI
jgi:hypothetical protein